jgi:hypothetical protein
MTESEKLSLANPVAVPKPKPKATATPQGTKKPKAEGNNRPKYATVQNPTIEAILGEHFRFASVEQAKTRLEALRETFIVCKLPADVDSTPTELKLWIRDYGLSPEARELGYTGNYARFEIKPVEKGKFTISPVLLSIDKKFHPQRKQVAGRHPNWGHPIMRDIQKGRVHKTVDAAQNELARLHEIFPEVSIPLTNKMYIMVYQKPSQEGEPPIKKWVLEIKALDSGGFSIAAEENTYATGTKKKAADVVKQTGDVAPKKPNEAIGSFTARVLLKQSKKKPVAPRPKPQNEG